MKESKKRGRWILEKINFFKQFYPKKTERLYEAGETYLYLGQQYRLKIQQSVKAGVCISDKFIVLSSHYPNKKAITKELLETWFITKAKEQFKERLQIILRSFPEPELVMPKGMIVRALSSRWGSMSSAGNMTLNSKLIHASIECIDYVITHELCHRIHFNHSKEFWALVERAMPDWKERKAKLELELC
jgi:predicted metal-dependent hydrolase